MATLLDDYMITDALRSLPGWSRDGDALVRTAALPSFPAAIGVVSRVAEEAEAMDHHPDIDIRWRNLTFRRATPSQGGISDLDTTLAATISEEITAAGGE